MTSVQKHNDNKRILLLLLLKKIYTVTKIMKINLTFRVLLFWKERLKNISKPAILFLLKWYGKNSPRGNHHAHLSYYLFLCEQILLNIWISVWTWNELQFSRWGRRHTRCWSWFVFPLAENWMKPLGIIFQAKKGLFCLLDTICNLYLKNKENIL